MSEHFFGKKFLWILITLLPLGICYLLYKSYTSELMVDFIAFTVYSLVISITCILLLIILKRIDTVNYKIKKWTRIWVIFFGTPVINILTWLYFALFTMSFEWSQSKVEDYTITKYQNLLRAKFYYCDEKKWNDTIVVTINRNNKIKGVAKMIFGKEMPISEKIIDSNELLLKLNILKYEN